MVIMILSAVTLLVSKNQIHTHIINHRNATQLYWLFEVKKLACMNEFIFSIELTCIKCFEAYLYNTCIVHVYCTVYRRLEAVMGI